MIYTPKTTRPFKEQLFTYGSQMTSYEKESVCVCVCVQTSLILVSVPKEFNCSLWSKNCPGVVLTLSCNLSSFSLEVK